jgi:hypothetical protein
MVPKWPPPVPRSISGGRQSTIAPTYASCIPRRTSTTTFEYASQFKYLGTTVTNQNLVHEEIKRRLNSGNACYHSVQNLLSSLLLSKNIKMRICNTIIFPVALNGCETWSLTLREKHRLRVLETAEEDLDLGCLHPVACVN